MRAFGASIAPYALSLLYLLAGITMHPKLNALTKVLPIFSVGLYLLSLPLPALFFEKLPPMTGVEVLQCGWLGILVLDPRWYANLAFVQVSYFNHKRTFRPRWSVFGILLIAGTYLFPIHYFPTESSGIPVVALGPGAYVWTASLVICFSSNLCLWPKKTTSLPTIE